MSSLKRKMNDVPDEVPHWSKSSCETGRDELQLEAREADVFSGRRSTAQTLESLGSPSQVSQAGEAQGSKLLKWDVAAEEDSAWVDRYDARLLLSTLPSQCRTHAQEFDGSPESPSGWSDLPSDSEEMFFLSREAMEERRAAKRKKGLEDAREERLAAMHSLSDDNVSEVDYSESVTYLSDEEPDEAQLQLMQRTAFHLHSSPDHTRLAARILVNHGADCRFAFLRGRWKRAWANAQQAVATEGREKAEATMKDTDAKETILNGLGDYGESDDDDEDPLREGERASSSKVQGDVSMDPEEAKKEARRQRAREWSLRRREKSNSDLGGEHL